LIFLAAGLITATAETIPALLFAWEIMGATSYALIGFWWREPDRVSAGITAFLTTRTADAGLYVAAGAALASGAGLTLVDLPSGDRKSTRLNSSHVSISYAVLCLKKKNNQ